MNMKVKLIALVIGVMTIVIGLVLADVIIDTAAASGASGLIACHNSSGVDSNTSSLGSSCPPSGSTCGTSQNAACTTYTVAIYPHIGSFSGAKSVNDLVPLIYYTIVVMLGVGMIGLGTAGIVGRGPLR